MKKRILSMLLALCLMAGMLTVMASAEDAAITDQAAVRIHESASKRSFIFAKEGEPATYYLTNADGYYTKENASATNYNIKFEWPAGGTATLSLKDAKIVTNNPNTFGLELSKRSATSDGNTDIITDFDLIINVETDSSITANTSKAGIYAINEGNLTITGPGKLSVYSHEGPAIHKAYGEVVIKDAKLKAEAPCANTAMTTAPAIFSSANITIDNSEAELSANNGPAIYIAERLQSSPNGDPFDIIIKNGSKVTATSAFNSLQNSAVSCMGKIEIDNSRLEITTTNGMRVLSKKPTMTGVNALGGESAEETEAYVEKNYAKYTYFVAGPDVVLPAPEEPAPGETVTPPATEGGATNNSPQTGDASILLLTGVAVLAMFGFAGVVAVNRKKYF